eukprot:604447-Amphidinium_carterae.1
MGCCRMSCAIMCHQFRLILGIFSGDALRSPSCFDAPLKLDVGIDVCSHLQQRSSMSAGNDVDIERYTNANDTPPASLWTLLKRGKMGQAAGSPVLPDAAYPTH